MKYLLSKAAYLLAVPFVTIYGVTKTYSRPKSTTVNSTGMVFTLKAEEKPETPAAFQGSGNTGNLDCRIQCDADESGGSDVQDLFKIEATPSLSAEGVITVLITVTPIKGDASAGTVGTLTVTHDQTMDVWQTAAGRARQS